MDRRRFLIALGAGGAAAAGLAGCSDDGDDTAGGGTPTSSSTSTATTTIPIPAFEGDPFTLGVASGDPDPTSVVLWTRLAPRPLEGGGMPDQPAPVQWEVALDEAFADVVASGVAIAEPRWGHSVHVTPQGLEPDTWYWYRFTIGEHRTAPARTRTAPARDAEVERLRFGFASCQHFETGWYNAHRDIAATEDLDLVLFLGDYIYEGGIRPVTPGETVREHNSPEVTDLDAYRNRYALYRSDADLRAAHARCPWVVIWDDHEVENNHAGDHSEDTSVDPAVFRERRAAAYQAWYEHMPVRLDPPDGADLRIYRSIEWGSLASILMTDERQYRTDQACGDEVLDFDPACGEQNSPGRTMLGEEQLQWLLDGLDSSTAAWRIWGNEVVMTPITVGEAILNYDQWDGYPAERTKVLEHLDANDMTNVVVVTGDIHLAGVADLTLGVGDAGKVVATELVGTSISSRGLLPPGTEELVTAAVPAIKYVNGSQRGWTLCDVTAERWTAEYRVVRDNLTQGSPIDVDATFTITPDRPGAVRS